MPQKQITNPQIESLDASKVTGTLPVANGGTGQSTLTANNVLLGNGTSALQVVAPGTSGNVLTSDGTTWTSAPASGGGGASNYWKDGVRAATTANGTLASAFANGSVIDGITLVTGDRILIKNQTTTAENGIYTVNASGAPTRATDADATGDLQLGTVVQVRVGTVNGGSNWQLISSNASPPVPGTSTQIWIPMQGIAIHQLNSITAPVASATGALAIGGSAQATGSTSVAIGRTVLASAVNSISIGSSISTQSSSAADIRIGANIATSSGNGGNTILGGLNTAQQLLNTIAISPMNRAIGTIGGQLSNCIVIGGNAGATAATTLGIAFGDNATLEMSAEVTFGLGIFSALADKKISLIGCHTTTSNATPAEIGTATLGSTGSTAPTGRIILTNDSSYIFECSIIARNTATDTESKAWKLTFAIRRGAAAANTALIGTATKTVIGEDTGTSTWDVSVTADTTNGRPNISVTGEAAKTIRWVSTTIMTKVSG